MSGKGRALAERISIDPDEALAPPPRRLPPEPPAADSPPEPAPPSVTAAVPEEVMEAVTPATAPAPPARRPRSTKRTRTIEPAAEPEEETAPIPYRSFYVDNATYERFRAATYWTARHPDAVDDPTVAQNMSQAVERFMAATADDLEHRYNRGQPFRIPPKARRRPR